MHCMMHSSRPEQDGGLRIKDGNVEKIGRHENNAKPQKKFWPIKVAEIEVVVILRLMPEDILVSIVILHMVITLVILVSIVVLHVVVEAEIIIISNYLDL